MCCHPQILNQFRKGKPLPSWASIAQDLQWQAAEPCFPQGCIKRSSTQGLTLLYRHTDLGPSAHFFPSSLPSIQERHSRVVMTKITSTLCTSSRAAQNSACSNTILQPQEANPLKNGLKSQGNPCSSMSGSSIQVPSSRQGATSYFVGTYR